MVYPIRNYRHYLVFNAKKPMGAQRLAGIRLWRKPAAHPLKSGFGTALKFLWQRTGVSIGSCLALIIRIMDDQYRIGCLLNRNPPQEPGVLHCRCENNSLDPIVLHLSPQVCSRDCAPAGANKIYRRASLGKQVVHCSHRILKVTF